MATQAKSTSKSATKPAVKSPAKKSVPAAPAPHPTTAQMLAAERLLRIVKETGQDMLGLAEQLDWHSDLASLAAPHYSGPLSLAGLVQMLSSTAHRLEKMGNRLEALGGGRYMGELQEGFMPGLAS